jgi:hypothetical protein
MFQFVYVELSWRITRVGSAVRKTVAGRDGGMAAWARGNGR